MVRQFTFLFAMSTRKNSDVEAEGGLLLMNRGERAPLEPELFTGRLHLKCSNFKVSAIFNKQALLVVHVTFTGIYDTVYNMSR